MSDPGRIPGPTIAPATCQVNVRWTLPNSRVGINALHGAFTGSFTPTVAIANSIMTGLTTGAAWTAYAAHLAGPSGLAGIDLRDISAAGNALVSSTANGVAGTGPPPPLAAHTALVATLRTARAGRNARGRAYLPCFSSAAMAANGQGVAGLSADVNAWLATWSSVFTTVGLTLCIPQPARQAYTGETGTAHPARPVAPSLPVTSVSLRNVIFDTQRRREGRS